MGISLTGLTPATTYDALIKVGDNGPIDGTLKVLSDGLGTNLPMEASTTGVNFTGTTTVSGVAVANTTQLATKQDTLVSGTNIKTINSTSILGSGNISVVASPSGVSGAIQFSNGSAFASDATNFFWDDTNNRLGIGTNAPTRQVELLGSVASPAYLALRYGTATGGGPVLALDAGAAGLNYLIVSTTSSNGSVGANALGIYDGTDYRVVLKSGNLGVGEVSPTARTQIKGSGSTSATTSLLVQNSAGSSALTIKDDLSSLFGGDVESSGVIKSTGTWVQAITFRFGSFGSRMKETGDGQFVFYNNAENNFNSIQLGGTTSSFPAIKRSSTTLQARLADDSGYAPIDASLYKVGGTNGFTGTGSYTNFTIVGGIITNAS
jgi:hypothetical protein